MRRGFFTKLAWTGIAKNRKIYLPYLLSCVGMIGMFFIFQNLSASPLLSEMSGGGQMKMILGLGRYVIAAFALLFLFYTNSFLTRRRNREFGLYNVLGMDKKGLCRVVLRESAGIAAVSLVGGIALGAVFSKVAELGLMNAVRGEVTYGFSLSWDAVKMTALLFGGIFVALLLRSLWQVARSNPLELMKSEAVGEKPPKASPLLGVAGILLLGAAYWIAVSITSPLSALLLFFVAVLMVIAATYLLFISGSVWLCRLLQKNKRYYYRKQHFVSVSGMTFRMKRNGAGLASVCVLCTMVLVMLASASALYFGAEDSLNNRYIRPNVLTVLVGSPEELTEENFGKLRARYDAVFERYGVEPEDVCEFSYADLYGVLNGAELMADIENADESISAYERLRAIVFLSDEEYSRLTGHAVSVAPGNALVYADRCRYAEDHFSVNGITIRVTGDLSEGIKIGNIAVLSVPSVLFVVSDLDFLTPLSDAANPGGTHILDVAHTYGYALNADDETAATVFDALREEQLAEDGFFGGSFGCVVEEKDDFFSAYGSLFFLGITLSIVFVFALVMILYYKQISEGYEDRARFAVMQQVGMTGKEIRKSINSQILTVFFAPLLLSGLHLAFSFPLIWKILQLFGLNNGAFCALTFAGAFALFGLFYALVYKITARAYYSIVR